MTQPLLVLDAHYLCHRAFWSQRNLAWQGVPTGVIFGFLKSIGMLKAEFQTDRIAFCFESPASLRRKIFPAYKQKREMKKLEPDVAAARLELLRQIDLLRDDYLPTMGFRNIFCFGGYESDDIMARIGQRDDWVILVTSDQDLYQCLRPNLSIYAANEKKLITIKQFTKTYGIKPSQWAVMKALAGCSTDGVPGIGRVGETTALKWIRSGQAPSLTPEQKKIVHRNRLLVELPFDGCPTPEIRSDDIDRNGWDVICSNLGMKSLLGRYPIYGQPSLI